MSPRARQLYVIAAIAMFCVAAPLVLLRASGYVWAGWKTGWQKTGLIAISASTKADVRLNGVLIGPTPQRMTHLNPGTYTLELRAAGRATWATTIHLNPGDIHVAGPITLFSSPLTAGTQEIPASTESMVVDQRQHVFAVSPHGSSWDFMQVWPTSGSPSTLTEKPTAVISSPSGQMSIVTTATHNVVLVATQRPWSIAPMDDWTWSSVSDNIAFGLRDDHLWRVDGLQTTETDLGPATSISASDTLYSTTTSANTTTITRRNPVGDPQPKTIVTIEGTWEFFPGVKGKLFVRNQDTRELDQFFPSDGRREFFGHIDKLFWDNQNQPPLWTDGSDLLTTGAKGSFTLLDRRPGTITDAAWIDPGNTVLIVDDAGITIRSVSDRQGYQDIVGQALPEGSTILGVSTARQTITVLEPTSTRPHLVVYHW